MTRGTNIVCCAATGPRFHGHSGEWTDTHIALHRQDHTDGLVSELDPDATTRLEALLIHNSLSVTCSLQHEQTMLQQDWLSAVHRPCSGRIVAALT